MGIEGNKKINVSGIDKLPNELLVNIVSHLSVKESARASLLARRWRDSWRFNDRILRFDDWDTTTEKEQFDSVVELLQVRAIEGVVINFNVQTDKEQITISARAIDGLMDFAMQKGAQMFALYLSFEDAYTFPSIERLVSHSTLCHLRTLRLAHVGIKDVVVHYILSSCPNLEELSIHFSRLTKNLRIMDPPRLRVLEISECCSLQRLEISAVNLVSLKYKGEKNNLVLKKIPNLRELNIFGKMFFVMEPKEHWSYSDQLEKLVLDFRFMYDIRPIAASTDLPQLRSLKRLDVKVYTEAGHGILFLTSLVNAFPQICEFRIELSYSVYIDIWKNGRGPIADKYEENVKFVSRNPKVIEVAGYIGCSNEEKLLLALLEMSPSIERVVIDTESDYYDRGATTQREIATKYYDHGATTRDEARMHAGLMVSKFPLRIQSTVT